MRLGIGIVFGSVVSVSSSEALLQELLAVHMTEGCSIMVRSGKVSRVVLKWRPEVTKLLLLGVLRVETRMK